MNNFPMFPKDDELLQFINLDKENDASSPDDDVPVMDGIGNLDMRSDMSSFYDAQMEPTEPIVDEKPLLERWRDRITAAMTPNFGPVMPSLKTEKYNENDFVNQQSLLSEASSAASANDSTPASMSSQTHSNKANLNYSEAYRRSQLKLTNLEFGRNADSDLHNAPRLEEDTGINSWEELISQHEATDYKYRLHILEFPRRSRVETQIKCRLVFEPSPEEHLVHLPPDTIARPRFQLAKDFVPEPDTLQLSVDIISPTAPQKALFMCSKCMNREKKRAFRKKNLDPNEENHWCDSRNRRLAIFNCREIISFPLAKACDMGDNRVIEGREIELPLRLACYCRHHPAKEGFRVIFTARDYVGNIVGRAISGPILITDDHKESKAPSYLRSDTGSATHLSNYSASGNTTGPPSPVSMEDSSDFSSSTSYKRRRESDWAGSTRQMSRSGSVIHQRLADVGSPSSSDGGLSFKPNPMAMAKQQQPSGNNPVILRVIPSQGSIRGGIEVTLLGSGFQNGMTAMFGGVKSVSTHCWNDSTIVTQLPPAAQSGPVLVAFDGFAASSPQMFTYVDDTDRQLIELALQVVGLKMNGKLEDARNIAMRIVGTNQGHSVQSSAAVSPEDANTSFATDNHEQVILGCISLADLKQGMVPNWQLRNTEGQTLMHLASIMGYSKVVSSLLGKGARVDIQDLNGMTALHFAALHGHEQVAAKLLKHHADPYQQCILGKNAVQLLRMGENDDGRESELAFGSAAFPDRFAHHSRRRSSTSTIGSSDTRSLESFNRETATANLLPTAVFPESNDYTDSGEFDWESGNDDDLWIEEPTTSGRTWLGGMRGVEQHGSEDDSGTRVFTHYEGRNLPPRIKPNAAEYLSNYWAQLTTNARNKIHWDQWDQLIRKSQFNRIRSNSPEPESNRTATSASESDTTVGGARAAVARVSVARVWQYLTQQELAARKSSLTHQHHPPSYEEIFPGQIGEMFGPVGEKFRRGSAGAGNVQVGETQAVEEEEEDFEEKFVQTWIINRKQLKNDKMLFFFWIPLLLLAVLYVSHLISQSRTDTGKVPDWQEATRQWIGNAIIGHRSRQVQMGV